MSGNASHPSWHTPQLVVVTFVWSGLIVALVGMSIVIYLQHRLLRFKIRARMSADETAVQHVSCNHPMHLSCVDLTYTAPNGKRILDRVSLSIPPGEVVAVMGPSGSGKTTCLDVLAGRRRGVGTTEGRVFAAHRDLGEHASFEHFRAHSAYMLQLAQTFSPGLSVRENLIYAALLRMGSESFEACVARVDQIIIELGMKEIEHVIVGGATGGGISGGQKRKLMLGIELLASPSLLFLDEPTSGLDAASTLAVMNALRVVAATGRSILITIHQPRASVFAGFDRLLLLYNGSVAFFGRPLDAHQLLLRVYDACRQEAQRPSQGSAEGGVVDPDALAAAEAEHENPADFVLDCLGKTAVLDAARMPRRRAGLARPSRADAEGSLAATSLDVSMVMGEVMTRLFRTAGVAAALSTAILPAVTLAPPQLETVQTTRRATRGVREAWVRAWVLTSRLLRGMGVGAYLAIAVQHALVLVLMGSLFYRPTEPMVAAGSIFNFVMMVTGPMLNPVTLAVCDALFTTYQHEVAAGVVTPAQFLLHMLVFLSSWTALSAVPLMAGGQVLTLGAFDATKLGYSVAVALFDSQAFIAITLFTCCAVFYRGGRDNALPMILAGTLQSMYALFSGFFISKDHAPPYWGWLFEICPRYRSVTAAIIINLEGTAQGDGMLEELGYTSIDVGANVSILMGMWLAFLLLAWVLLQADVRKWSLGGAWRQLRERCQAAAALPAAAAPAASSGTAASDVDAQVGDSSTTKGDELSQRTAAVSRLVDINKATREAMAICLSSDASRRSESQPSLFENQSMLASRFARVGAAKQHMSAINAGILAQSRGQVGEYPTRGQVGKTE